MSIRRVYDPDECDEQGVPLDWERCRLCDGSGELRQMGTAHDGGEYRPCERCGGHGSLKAAALHEKSLARFPSGAVGWVMLPVAPIRCESCSHPMSEGTWDDPFAAANLGLGYVETRARGERLILRGEEPRAIDAPGTTASLHYSPCDDGCRHDGDHVRWHVRGQGWIEGGRITEPIGQHITRMGPPDDITGPMPIEASWRPVDIRCLGWPHDLRPEKLAVLCLRCFAERSRASA